MNTTKVQSITSANGETKNVTIDKSKIPIGDSFTLKLEIKDLIGGVSTVTKTITRYNNAPTVSFTSCPTQFTDTQSYVFKFKASDTDSQDTSLKTNILINGSKLTGGFSVSPTATVSSGTITTAKNTEYTVTINASSVPAADSFTIKLETADLSNAKGSTSTNTITRSNRAPSVSFVSTPNFKDNVAYTFKYKATDPDTRVDATLYTDVYVGTTKVASAVSSGNGSEKSVTIDKSKIPSAESFTLKVITKDKKGTTSSEVTKTITRSNQTPSVTIKTCPSSIHKLDNLTFTFNASDADTRIDTTLTNEIYVGSTLVQTITTNNGADQSITIDKSKLSDSFTLKVTTKDKKGATASATKTITRYNNAPTVTITSSPQFIDNQNYVFKFKANDSDSQDTSLSTSILINGSKLTSGITVTPTATVSSGIITTAKNTEYTVTIDKSELPAIDSFTLKLESTDLSGAVGSTTQDIARSNQAPTVTIKTCPSSIHKLDNLTVTFNASDADINVDTTLTNEIYIGSTLVDTVTSNNGVDKSITIDKSKLSDVFTLKIITKDKLGATNTVTKDITRYNNIPTVEITSSPQFIDNQNYVFKFKANDTDSQDTSLKTNILINGTKLTDSFTISPTVTVSSGTITTAKNTEYEVTIDKSKVPVVDSFTLKVETTDLSGAVGSASKDITRSNQAPTVVFVTTSNFKDNDDYTFTFKATDLDTRIDTTLTTDVYVDDTKVVAEVSSGNGSNKNVTITKDKIPAAESFVLKVVTKDTKGATGEVSKTINRENRTPTVKIKTCPDNIHKLDNLTIAFSASDPDTRIDATLINEIYVGTTLVQTVETNNGEDKEITIDKSKLNDAFILKIITKDKLGATNTVNKDITRYNNIPTVEITSSPQFIDNQNYVFKFKANDTDSQDTSLKTNILINGAKLTDGFTVTPTATVSNGTITTAKNTEYEVTIDKGKVPASESFTLEVETTDLSGIVGSASKDVTRSNQAPTVAFVTTPNFKDNEDYIFTFKATDLDTRIDTTLTTDVYVDGTKVVADVSSGNGSNKNVTITKDKIPVAESFVLKVVTKDTKGATGENSKTINRENRTPTVTIKTCPDNIHKLDNLTITFSASDPDTRVDATLINEIYVDTTLVETVTTNNGADKEIIIDKSKLSDSFTLKVTTRDKLGATNTDTRDITRYNNAPRVEITSSPQFIDNQNYVFKFKANDIDSQDTSLKTDILINGAKLTDGFTITPTATVSSGTITTAKDTEYEVTIDKGKVPVADSFTLKLETTDLSGAVGSTSQNITRSNKAPTVAIKGYPVQIHKRENNLSFEFTVSDVDIRIDSVLTTNIELDGRIVSEADLEISPAVSVANGNIPALNGTTYQVTIKNKTKYISPSKNDFTLNVKTEDTCGAVNNQAITINNINNAPNFTIAKDELSLAYGKISKLDHLFSFKITVSDSDQIDQKLNVEFYIVIDGQERKVTTFKADSQNITAGNLIAANNKTYIITIDKSIPAENPLIPITVDNFTLKAVVTDDLFSTGDDEIDLIHYSKPDFNTPPKIEFLNLEVNQEIRKLDNILNFDLILKDKDAADDLIKVEMYIKTDDSSNYQKINQFTVNGLNNNSGVLIAQNGTKYSIAINKGVFVPMSASEFTIKVIATDTGGEKTEKELTLKQHTDIIAQWALDSVKNNIAVDSSGNDNNGIINGAAFNKGILGGALEFDGLDDYVAMSMFLNEAITTNSFSVEAWVKTTDVPSAKMGIIGNHHTTTATTTGYWALSQCGSVDVGKFEFTLCDGKETVSIKSPESLNDGKWHHVVGVREAKQNQQGEPVPGVVRLYVDGKLVGEGVAPLGSVNSEQNIILGLLQNSYFKGYLDEVTLYSCALSADEVRKNYERIVFLTDLTMTNQHNNESTNSCAFGTFRNKLEFTLKKVVNGLVIKLELPSNIKMQKIEAVLKKDNQGNYTPVSKGVSVAEDGMITFTEPLEPGKYRIDILLSVDGNLINKAEYFQDENMNKINYKEELFRFKFLDFNSLADLM